MVTRSEAARELVAALREHEGRHGVYVIVVTPGSLWLAAEVAQQRRVPFDLFPVRAVHDTEDEQGPPVRLVGSGGVLVVDQATVAARGCSLAALAEASQAAARRSTFGPKPCRAVSRRLTRRIASPRPG